MVPENIHTPTEVFSSLTPHPPGFSNPTPWNFHDFSTWVPLPLHPLHRRSLSSSRNRPPPRTSGQTKGTFFSPLLVHVPTKAADFGPREVCKKLQWKQVLPFNNYVDIKLVDVNALSARSCGVLCEEKDGDVHIWTLVCMAGFYQILVQMSEACGKSAWNLRNDHKTAKY